MRLAPDPLRVPCAGLAVTVKARTADSRSEPVSVIALAVFSLTNADWELAAGGLFGGARMLMLMEAGEDVRGGAQARPGVPQLSGLPRSVTVNWIVSLPTKRSFGV